MFPSRPVPLPRRIRHDPIERDRVLRSLDPNADCWRGSRGCDTRNCRSGSKLVKAMDGTTTITFRRSRRSFAVFRRLKVLLDGTERLSLRYGEQANIHVQPGEHTVQTKMDWCHSNLMRLRCTPGQSVVVDCDSQPLLLAALCCFIAPARVFRVAEGVPQSLRKPNRHSI